MTALADPNGLALTGALFMLSGAAVLGQAFTSTLQARSGAESEIASMHARVASYFGLPMALFGLFCHAAGQVTSMPLSPALVCIILGLALTLLLYVTLEGSIVDTITPRAAQTGDVTRMALPAPKLVEALRPEANMDATHKDAGHKIAVALPS